MSAPLEPNALLHGRIDGAYGTSPATRIFPDNVPRVGYVLEPSRSAWLGNEASSLCLSQSSVLESSAQNPRFASPASDPVCAGTCTAWCAPAQRCMTARQYALQCEPH